MTLPLPKMLRALLRRVWIAFLYCGGLLWWAKRRLAAQGGVVVLTFHRVLADTDYERTNSPRGMAVRESTFRGLAEHLAKHCKVVSLEGGVSDWNSSPGKPRVALTFDDGWADNASCVFGTARNYNLPWTVFICPERAGHSFPFWPERVVALWRAAERQEAIHRLASVVPGAGQSAESLIEKLKKHSPDERDRVIHSMSEVIGEVEETFGRLDASMTWEEIAALADAGVSIGSHTASHAILTRVAIPEAQREITLSKQAIEQKLLRECRLFAYPNGDWSPQVRDLVEEAGYKLAFANRPGVWKRDCDAFVVPRTNLWEGSLVGSSGRFSRIAFEYVTFWTAWRADRARPAVAHRPTTAAAVLTGS